MLVCVCVRVCVCVLVRVRVRVRERGHRGVGLLHREAETAAMVIYCWRPEIKASNAPSPSRALAGSTTLVLVGVPLWVGWNPGRTH